MNLLLSGSKFFYANFSFFVKLQKQYILSLLMFEGEKLGSIIRNSKWLKLLLVKHFNDDCPWLHEPSIYAGLENCPDWAADD